MTTLLRKLSPNEYSPESVVGNAVIGAVMLYGVWRMIDEKLEKRREAERSEISRPLNQIRTIIKDKFLMNNHLEKLTPVNGDISSANIAEKIHPPGKFNPNILMCFEEGVGNLEKLLKAIETHLEPMAKMMKAEDDRLCALAKGLDPNNDEHSDKVDAELAKANKKLAHVAPPYRELGRAATWYLPGYTTIARSDAFYIESAKKPNFPDKVKPLSLSEAKRASEVLLKALDIIEKYDSLTCAGAYHSYHDDGEHLREFYDTTNNMDTYYDLTEGDRWSIDHHSPFKSIVTSCQGMMHYIEKSFK